MSGTVTHDVAQYLNSIIRPYLNSQYIIQSSDELLVHLETMKLQPTQQLCSLDVESLFTNVPVDTTIDIIINAAYSHHQIPPPPMPPESLRSLLTI